jgi:hypothetical protein
MGTEPESSEIVKSAVAADDEAAKAATKTALRKYKDPPELNIT